MKELSIEEKAKAYDLALDRAKEKYAMFEGMKQGDVLEDVFPELKESGDWIPKEIIKYLEEKGDFRSCWIAWLEKQKTSEEALQYLKDNHSPSEVSDFQTAMNIAVAKAYDKGMKDGLEKQGTPQDKGEISDGYHTFNELYYYRMLYNAAFFNMLPKEWVHKSKKHHDGEDCFGGGWFIVMANLPTGQVSNHYELKDWDLFQIPEKEVADKWDGHTPQEAADRLRKYLLEKQGDQATTKKFSTSEVIDMVRQALRECESFSDIKSADLYAAEAIATVDDFIKNQSEQKPIDYNEELKKCRENPLYFFDKYVKLKLKEQKPTWSKEDEKAINDIMWIIEAYRKDGFNETHIQMADNSEKWLKSLRPQRMISTEAKEAMYGKPTAWSEEDKKMSRFIGNAITADDSSLYLKNKGIEVIDAHVWLDELKDRVLPQPKQEENKGNLGGISSNWSEEDEKMRKKVLLVISDDCGVSDYEEISDWLKSLKQRIGG